MNLNFDSNQFRVLLADYSVGPAVALENATLQTIAQNYKRQLSNQMYPIEKPRIAEKIPSIEGYQVSRKIDGEFCLLFFDGEKTISCNPGGTVRAGLPCFEEFSNLLSNAGVSSGVFACELFVKKKERERVHHVVRIARKPADRKQLASLAVYVFDIVELDEVKIDGAKEVSDKIEELFDGGVLVRPIEVVETDNSGQIIKLFEQLVEEENSEGLVVRHDSLGWFKIKPVHPIDCVIVGFSDSVNERKGMLHDLLVGLVRNDGGIQLLGKVGGGFTEDQRKEIFEDLQKSVVPSDYVEVSSAYLAYEWVEPSQVVEIKCLDLISEKSRGDNINKMVLNWDEKQSKYLGVRKMPFVSLIAPRFERMRPDKSVNADEVSTKQVSALVDIENIEKKLADIKLPNSEMLKREVYYKTMGEKMMIRKVLLWKTNKEETGEFPAFIAFYTDFSTQRKDPLGTALKPANSLESGEKEFDALLEDAVKKGWEKYVGSDV